MRGLLMLTIAAEMTTFVQAMNEASAACKRFADEAFAAYPMRVARGMLRRQWARRGDGVRPRKVRAARVEMWWRAMGDLRNKKRIWA